MQQQRYFYSIDSGKSWEGPFNQMEITHLKAAGIIDNYAIIREETPQAAPTPPVYDNNDSYLILVNGIPQGPFNKATLCQMLQNGALSTSDLAWAQGMSVWQPLSRLLSPADTSGALPKLHNFSIGRFFSEVFKHHSKDELLDLLISGTRQGTPPLASVSTVFPAPWVFARIFLFCLIVSFGFYWALRTFNNANLVPGYIFIGNFGIPFCVFLLFYELNVRRDVSLYDGIKAVIGGGILSLAVSLFFFSTTGANLPLWAGPIEETGKLLAVILIASKLRNGRILTGMLLGAAVGAGFAAFESAGYIYREIIEQMSLFNYAEIVHKLNPAEAQQAALAANAYDPESLMLSRALFSPGAHIVWTAITAGAYWMIMNARIQEGKRAKDSTAFDFSILIDKRFLLIAILPVALHMLWNSVGVFLGTPVFITLGLVGWFFALRMVNAGLAQIEKEKSQLYR